MAEKIKHNARSTHVVTPIWFLPVLSQSAASQFLVRHRRANALFEEHKKGNLERECIEELCNKEEAREVFENQPETVRWATSPQPCVVLLCLELFQLDPESFMVMDFKAAPSASRKMP